MDFKPLGIIESNCTLKPLNHLIFDHSSNMSAIIDTNIHCDIYSLVESIIVLYIKDEFHGGAIWF